MVHIIRFKNDLGEFINEECITKDGEYIKEYYSEKDDLIKTELIKKGAVLVVRYENCGTNFAELLAVHLKEYGNVTADFLAVQEMTNKGYKKRGHLFENGKLLFVRETYYDSLGDIVKEVSLNSKNNYEPTMVEYYEYDDQKELIGITQKTMDGRVISYIDF